MNPILLNAQDKLLHRPISTKHFTPLGAVRSVEETPRGLLLGVGDERFRVDILDHDLLRLKISQARIFDEDPTFAVIGSDTPSVAFEVHQDDKNITLTTKQLKLVMGREPFRLSLYRTDGSLIFEDAIDSRGRPVGYLQLNDTFVVTRKLGRHDSIYGLGQKTGASDRRGRSFIMWNTDILQPGVLEANRLHETDLTQHGRSTSYDPYYSTTPFFYHCRESAGKTQMAGFFIDNSYKAHFEFQHDERYRYSFEGGQYTEYVFAGPRMPDILSAYTKLTGRMSAPPLWALGVHQCRFHDYDQEDVLRIASEYRSRDLPCDVMWFDIHHMNGFRVFTWDPKRFNDVSGMLAQLTESQFRSIAIVDPGVKLDPGYPIFEEGYANNYFCKTEGGKLYVGQVWPGHTVFPDFSREEVRTWWGDLNARHAAGGLSGIWNDMNEPATGDVPPFGMRFDYDGDNHPHERFHNQYALLMAMGTHKGLLDKRPTERPFILTRAGFSGIQRYAAQWTGDNESLWEHMPMSISMSCGMGVSGQAFVGSDMPGFMGRSGAEMSVRWVQYGALTPFCRYHNNFGEPDQYPWSFGKGVEARNRDALKLRYRLLPYLYTSFIESVETGAPVQRPLMYHHQNDRQARETDDVYLLGPSLLVAPVMEAGQTTRNAYLPEGSWIETATGRAYEGHQFVTVDAPLERIPVFAKGGSVVPMLPEAPHSTMGLRPTSMDLCLYIPVEEGEFVSYLREDDGHSTQHETGAYLETKFTVTRKENTVKLTATVKGEGFPEFCRTQFRLIIRGAEFENVRVNGMAQDSLRGKITFDNQGQEFTAEVGL